MPDTLHALLAARLDALDPVARSLVADAAVSRRRFTVGDLARGVHSRGSSTWTRAWPNWSGATSSR